MFTSVFNIDERCMPKGITYIYSAEEGFGWFSIHGITTNDGNSGKTKLNMQIASAHRTQNPKQVIVSYNMASAVKFHARYT